MNQELTKRIFFDKLFMKLQNPDTNISSISEVLLSNIMSNKIYYLENSLKKVFENNN